MTLPDIAAAQALIKRRTIHEDRGFASKCWIWTGCSLSSGYGKLRILKAYWLAHRLSHFAFNGPIPPNYQVDHLCCQKACCNPDHLEAVTPLTNTVRALVANGQRLSPNVCKEGHVRTPANLREGRCRQCYEAAVRRWQQQRRTRRTLGDDEIVADEVRANRATLEAARDAIEAQLAKLTPRWAA